MEAGRRKETRERKEQAAHTKITRKECNPQIVGNGAIVELGESRNQVQDGERVA